VQDARARPYALTAGDGWIYNYGIDFAVKAGELGKGRQLAFVEYAAGARLSLRVARVFAAGR
jgi:hypothetical protein